MNKLILISRVLLFCLGTCLFTSCGQKGPLCFPEASQAGPPQSDDPLKQSLSTQPTNSEPR